MSADTAAYTASLSWSANTDEKAFQKLVAGLMLVTFLLSVSIGLIPLPEIPREEQERLPVRLAQIILEKKAPKPEPVVIPEPPEPKAIDKVVKAPIKKAIKAPEQQTTRSG
jgi:hypothetical protein